jgi:hypothetical protein
MAQSDFTVYLTVAVTPGDAARLKRVTEDFNAVQLAEGRDPLSEDDMAAAILRKALLAEYRSAVVQSPE